MKLIIHRGTKEIGGSFVEIRSNKARIIIDMGMPLVNAHNKRFDSGSLDGKSIPELIDNQSLPQIHGLYAGEEKSIDAVLLSHPHQDHYGLLRYINPEVPVYLSKGAFALIQASDIFIPTKANLHNVSIFKMKESFTVGDLSITPRLVDHSGFDAAAFLIEGEGKKVFYSGDFRGHGRKGVLLDIMCKYPEKDVDYLILEGSMIGRGEGLYTSEKAVEDKLTAMFKTKANIAFVFCSSQNIDRIVSIFCAARQNGQTTVIDLYTAYILDSVKHISGKLPQYWLKDVKVVFFPHHYQALVNNGLDIFLDEMADHEVTMDVINRDKKDIVMIVKDNTFFPKLINQLDEHAGALAIYSLWKGNLEYGNLEDTLKQKGIKLKEIHTSGHAPEQDLKRLVGSLKPKCVIPIHTFYPQDYQELFPETNVHQLKDGEEFIL